MKNINLSKLSFYKNMTEEEKQKYKLFFTTLINMGKNNFLIFKKLPDFNKFKLPYIILENKSGNEYYIKYSTKNNVGWLLSINDNLFENFNPSLNDLKNFLDNFELSDIEKSVLEYTNKVNEILLNEEKTDN